MPVKCENIVTVPRKRDLCNYIQANAIVLVNPRENAIVLIHFRENAIVLIDPVRNANVLVDLTRKLDCTSRPHKKMQLY